jgi:4-amino-4-deoxy-L-arabinose transferase-like glycosyltransferase
VTNLPKSERPIAAEPDSRWGGPATVLALVLLGAAVIRLVGIRYGLPYGGLLNEDEREIVPRAWGITHGAGLDPSPFFDWPPLLAYVLAPFEAWQSSPSYLAARLVVVVIGVAGVAAAWWLGERSYGMTAGGVAAVATGIAGVHVAYSRMAVTDILLTTLLTVALALLVSERLDLAGVAIGLAAAAKWPGAIALVPLVVVAWGRWDRLLRAAAFALLSFAVAAPFVFLHPGEAASDWWTVHEHARQGWLGFEHDSFSWIAFTGKLWDSLGPALIVALVGVAVAIARRELADRVLLSFAAAYWLALLPLGSHFDRYVLPLIPALGILAGRFRQFAPVTLLLLIVPFTWTVRDTKELTKTDTREAAVARVERAIGSKPLAEDPGLPRVRGDVLALELPTTWSHDPRRSFSRLTPGSFVWVNGDVVDRVRRARDDYPGESAFYDALEHRARRIFRLDPSDRLAGPWVALFQLPSGA